MNQNISVRLYDTLGCTIVGTALLQSLKAYLGDSTIHVYTANPELLKGLAEVNEIHDIRSQTLPTYDVDLSGYLEIRQPQQNLPLRHLYIHMVEIAEEQLGLKQALSRTFLPKINYTPEELTQARDIAQQLSPEKPLIWLQTRTRVKTKDWPIEHWQVVQDTLSHDYSFIDLSQQQYSPRMAVAITKFCTAGITLDSFLLHGSLATQAPNVLVLLVSSHPEVVRYEEQHVINGLEQAITPQHVIQDLRTILK